MTNPSVPKIAFVFPGQGSQAVGMGRALFEQFPGARAVYAEASDALGWDLARPSFDGPAEALNLTATTQPALLTASIAAWRVLTRRPIAAAYVAGHSLGEYTALVCAGAVSFTDAVRLVHQRGRYMQEAVPAGAGSMAAVLGLDRDAVVEVCRAAASAGIVDAANFNAPGQVVIAGERAAVQHAIELAQRAGAKRVVPLPVSVPSHCRLMQDAARRLEADLRRTTWSDPTIPVITNADARPLTAAEDIIPSLVRQLSSPLLWEDSIRTMIAHGASTFIEIGPGRVLVGLIKKIDRTVRVLNVEDPASVDAAWAALDGASAGVAS
jgi:[acyl-carrier-protein] S-malonyltransferase